MGRTASGVRGIKLREGDEVVGATLYHAPKDSVDEDIDHTNAEQVLLVSAKGVGKCIRPEDCRDQSRGGYGIIIYKCGERTGPLVGISTVSERDGLMIINSEGVIIRIRVADISVQGRYASGVKLINMAEGTTVVALAKITDGADSEENTNFDDNDPIGEMEAE